MSKVSVVIMNYNGHEYLGKFLPGFLTTDADIVVADNASTDDSIQLLDSTFPSVRVISFDTNFGFTGGYNRAMEMIDSEYVAIVNSDIEVSEGWLIPLVRFLDENPTYAAVQPKIKSYQSRNYFEYAGAAGGFVDKMGYPYCRGRIFETIEEDTGQYNEVMDVDWTSGACMLIRSEAFRKTNGFDEHFFAHMEEIDLCWRLKSGGWRLACLPESEVFHVGGGTLSKTSPKKTYLNFRNGLSLLVKNLPWSDLWWKLPIRLVLDGIAAFKFAVESSPKHMMAIFKAHLHFYYLFPSLLKMRKSTVRSGDIWIIWKYFVKKKRKFSELG